MQTSPARADIPAELTWNLDDLFASVTLWEAELAALDAALPGVQAQQGRLGESAATLLSGLDAVEQLQQRFMRVASFAHLRNAEDGSNPAHQAAVARVAALGARLNAAIAFVDAEILDLPDGAVERFMAQEPGLAPHGIALRDLLETKAHRLGAEAERTLAALGEVLGSPYMVYNRSKSSDMQFATFEDANGELHPNSINLFESTYEGHEDASVRRNAWRSFSVGLKAYQHTSAATFATETKKNVVLARLRNYPSTEAFLLQHHKVPQALYSNILNIIQAELAPHMRRYARLRRRVLGLDKLLYCDIKAPLDAAFNPRISYDEACTLLLDALAVMGPAYCSFIRQARTLGRPRQQRRQVVRGVLCFALWCASVHPDHLGRHHAQRLHLGA